MDACRGKTKVLREDFSAGTGVRGGTSPGRRGEARDVSTGARRKSLTTRGAYPWEGSSEGSAGFRSPVRRGSARWKGGGWRQTLSNVGMRGGPARESSVDAPAAPPPGTTARDAPRAHRRVPRPAATAATARTAALAAPLRVSVGTGRRLNVVRVTFSRPAM